MTPLLRYRAGPGALRILRECGLTAGTIGALAGSASGPKWLVLAGLDRALHESGLLQPAEERPLFVGASAGAWRMLALASRDAPRTHRKLLDGYVGMTFPRGVKPDEVSSAYRRMLGDVFPPEEVAHLAAHPELDLALHVVRARLGVGWSAAPRAAQMLSLGAAGLFQTVSPVGVDLAFERILFHTRPEAYLPEFNGRQVELNRNNLLTVAVATGTVPIYMQPQRDLPDAPPGHYLDGGLADYHLRQRYVADDRGITLFPHFQQRIVPVWFDRTRRRRSPTENALDSVLQIYPSERFLADLPDGRPPDRDDFFRFADDPGERIRRWREAARSGDTLGAEFLDDLHRGRIADLAEPL